MFNNQKDTDLQNFKTDESLIVFKKTTTDSAHLRCTGTCRLLNKQLLQYHIVYGQTSQSYSYLVLMIGRQQIGEGVMGEFPCNAWYMYVSTSNLYWHLLVAGSQCNSHNIP